MHMTRNQFLYYYRRLSLFDSDIKIAKDLRVSLTTFRRWKDGGLPPERHLGRFMDVLENKVDWLHKKVLKSNVSATSFFGHIADALILDDVPKFDPVEAPVTSTEWLIEDLKKRLAKGSVRSDKLFNEYRELGYTRSQVNYAAKKLKLRKNVRQMGRDGYSLWSLK